MPKLNKESLDKWESIIENVEKSEMPVNCLKRISIKLEDGKRKQISIAKLRKQGLESDQIEELLNRAITLLDNDIKSIDFYVDVEAVAELVQPETDRLLSSFGL